MFCVSAFPSLILPEHAVAPQDDMLQDLDGMISDPAIAIKVFREYGGEDFFHPRHSLLDGGHCDVDSRIGIDLSLRRASHRPSPRPSSDFISMESV